MEDQAQLKDFLSGELLHYELNDALLSRVDTQSASKDGVREVLDKSCELLMNMCAPEEKLIVQRFLASMGKEDGLAIHGLDVVLNALKNGEAEVALATDSTEIIELVAVCKKCAFPKTKTVDNKMKLAKYTGNDIEALREMHRG